MSTAALKRFEREATLLSRPTPRSDIAELAEMEMHRWKRGMDDIRATGTPMNVAGPFAGLEITPSPANQSTITMGATELLIWPSSQTPIPANPQTPKVYQVMSWGLYTSAATPGTFTLNPRLGLLITSPSLGISTAITPVASQTTTDYLLWGLVLVRGNGTANTATGIFKFEMSGNTTTSGTVPVAATNIFGNVNTNTFDSTTASALVVGAIAATSTTNTIIPSAVVWGSWN